MASQGLTSVRDELLKIAGTKLRRSEGPPYSRFSAKREVKKFLSSSDPDRWNRFAQNAESPQFVRALAKVKGVDRKLVEHAKSMHYLSTSKVVGNIDGSTSKPYAIKSLPGKRLGCTCNDWKYRGAATPGYKCKHIRAYEQGKDKVSMDFSHSLSSWADEVDRIAKSKQKRVDSDMKDGPKQRPFSSDLTRDEEPSDEDYRPNPAPEIEEMELIIGGKS